ncbi:MAG TPA: YaiO family outer membrane beta-barrel protein [Anditalea sp.]|nr:YaiO family outer membrane beta-barrel protein [Anditalea sp.]
MKKLNIIILMLVIAGLGYTKDAFGQKVNSDSLLYKALNETKLKNYTLAKKQAKLGVEIAPDYLDFHLLLGRLYQLTGQPDSARYYLNYVADLNPAYVEAFTYLTDLEIQQGNLDLALRHVNDGIEHHPDEQSLYFKKMSIFQIEERFKDEQTFIEGSLQRFPQSSELRQRLYFLETRNKTDRIGVTYSITSFDRDGVGPWHLTGVQYIRERGWGSLIGRINYADRQAFGESLTTGTQFEIESYAFIGRNGYTYISGAYSNSIVFPKIRLGLSYFHNYKNGWESELGGRYVEMGGRHFRSGIIGIGKYLGSFWLNGRAFIQNENTQYFPALTLTSRYYFNSRFDYFQALAGYGTSPDERGTLNQFENRVAMDSYRVGIGYFKLWNQHILTGTQVTYNHQELLPGLEQKEYELFLMLQYKF